jgi:hypothetical protein
MLDRDFSEVELRTMLEDAQGLEPDVEVGRWLVRSWHDGWTWEIVLEPDASTRMLVVITAYRLD